MKKAFLFSGQGAQYPGMGKRLYETYPSARRVFDTMDEVLGRPYSSLCFTGSAETLSLTENTQPCTLAYDLALASVVTAEGCMPDVVAGFSLGEYAALTFAGVITLGDAFRLIGIRSHAMQLATPVGEGAMAAVKNCPEELLEALCEKNGDVWCANYNSPEQIVISGKIDAVSAVVASLKAQRYRAVLLPVSAPFHTPLMRSVVPILERAFATITFSSPCYPIVMNYDGLVETDEKKIKEKVLLQTVNAVRWSKTLHTLSSYGVDTFYELGPGHTLSSFVAKTLSLPCTALDGEEALTAACSGS